MTKREKAIARIKELRSLARTEWVRGYCDAILSQLSHLSVEAINRACDAVIRGPQ